jgi:hypothetical protein
MAEYRFRVGDLVRLQIGILPKEGATVVDGTFKPLKGIYEVTHLVPVRVGEEPRYWVRGLSSQVERVVGESFLIPAVRSVQPRY